MERSEYIRRMRTVREAFMEWAAKLPAPIGKDGGEADIEEDCYAQTVRLVAKLRDQLFLTISASEEVRRDNIERGIPEQSVLFGEGGAQ